MSLDGTKVQTFLDTLVSEDSAAATCALAVLTEDGQSRWSGAAAVHDDRPSLETLFDIASLTKPIMATLALVLDRQRVLGLDTRIGDLWPRAGQRTRRLRLEQLLRHRSHLEPWRPLYDMVAEPGEALISVLLGDELLSAPLGTYSDLGYILWGLSVERALGTDLWCVLRERLLEPLALSGVTATPSLDDNLARCECDNAVEVRLASELGFEIATVDAPQRGVPHDGNAAFMGLAGHAGLFADARSLLTFADAWRAALDGRDSLLHPQACRRALSGGGDYALGWARRRVGGSAGRALPPDSFGHTGFSGTSLWIDRGRRRVMLLLAQRRSGVPEFNLHRRHFHLLAAAALAT